jgi:hypothetical protein
VTSTSINLLLNGPPGSTALSGIDSRFAGRGEWISNSRAIRHTFTGPHGVIKNAHDEMASR